MCNAWNHPAGCTCGWGGDGHLGGGGNRYGGSSSTYSSPKDYSVTRSFNWRFKDSEDFCKPSTCPICGASVYFVRHNGGSVWLDSLGIPWPKHPCFDDDFTTIRKNLVERKTALFGIVINVAIIDFLVKGTITTKCNNGEIIKGIFEYHGDIKYWLGQLLTIDKNDKRIILTNLSGKQIHGLPIE